MTEETAVSAAATNSKGKLITLLILVVFVMTVFTLTILKFAKVW